MTSEYRATELNKATTEWQAARARYEAATSRRAKRDAADDVEFWGNKMAFLQKAR